MKAQPTAETASTKVWRMSYEQDVKEGRISECGYFCTWQRQQDIKKQLADTRFEYMR